MWKSYVAELNLETESPWHVKDQTRLSGENKTRFLNTLGVCECLHLCFMSTERDK